MRWREGGREGARVVVCGWGAWEGSGGESGRALLPLAFHMPLFRPGTADMSAHVGMHHRIMNHYDRAFPGRVLTLHYNHMVNDMVRPHWPPLALWAVAFVLLRAAIAAAVEAHVCTSFCAPLLVQEGTTRRILKHCGLSFHPNMLKFYETKRFVYTASLLQARLLACLPLSRSPCWRCAAAVFPPTPSQASPQRPHFCLLSRTPCTAPHHYGPPLHPLPTSPSRRCAAPSTPPLSASGRCTRTAWRRCCWR